MTQQQLELELFLLTEQAQFSPDVQVRLAASALSSLTAALISRDMDRFTDLTSGYSKICLRELAAKEN